VREASARKRNLTFPSFSKGKLDGMGNHVIFFSFFFNLAFREDKLCLLRPVCIYIEVKYIFEQVKFQIPLDLNLGRQQEI